MSGKRKRISKKKPRSTRVLLIICLLLVIVILLMTTWIARDLLTGDRGAEPSEPTSQSGAETLSPETEPPVPEETKVDVYMQLPMLLEDGKLVLESLFQYTGLNPDAYWENGVNVGAVVLTNRSGQYLDKLDLAVTMSDGTVLNFLIQDLPPGKTVMAYELENVSYAVDVLIQNTECQAEFRENGGPTSDDVAIEISGMDVILTNHSKLDLKNVRIVCHNAVEGVYFGGTAYAYSVESLRASETATVTAFDCFLGELDVALIDYEN